MHWKKHLAVMTEIRSRILSRYLWYNESIQVDKASVHFLKSFLKKVSTSINYGSQLFSEFKREFNLHESSYFQWLQLIDFIPENSINLIMHGN